MSTCDVNITKHQYSQCSHQLFETHFTQVWWHFVGPLQLCCLSRLKLFVSCVSTSTCPWQQIFMADNKWFLASGGLSVQQLFITHVNYMNNSYRLHRTFYSVHGPWEQVCNKRGSIIHTYIQTCNNSSHIGHCHVQCEAHSGSLQLITKKDTHHIHVPYLLYHYFKKMQKVNYTDVPQLGLVGWSRHLQRVPPCQHLKWERRNRTRRLRIRRGNY